MAVNASQVGCGAVRHRVLPRDGDPARSISRRPGKRHARSAAALALPARRLSLGLARVGAADRALGSDLAITALDLELAAARLQEIRPRGLHCIRLSLEVAAFPADLPAAL